jgi:polyisoprenoid-binding protein YceI
LSLATVRRARTHADPFVDSISVARYRKWTPYAQEDPTMLRFTRATTLAAALISATGAQAAASWTLDSTHTSVQFAVRHLMVSTVRGDFTKVSGTVVGDEAEPTSAVVEASIDAASVDTRVAKRDEHLRSPDFLDVAKFPTITFKSTKVEKAGDGAFKVTGDLTLHGVTKSVVLDVTEVTPPVKDPWGNLRAGAHATAKINRKDFGLTWNNVLEAGGVAVGDEVAITVDVEAIRKP